MAKRFESAPVDPAPLGQPLEFPFANRTAKNRFLKGAMSERLSSWDPKNFEARGIPSKELINLYKRWGEGEYGVILTGNVMMFPDQLEAAGNPIVPAGAPFEGERFERFKELAAAGKARGSLIVAQVSHPGRQVVERINSNPISASDVQLQPTMGMTFGKPHAATTEEIQNIIDSFTYTAEYLQKAGYDGIQLHGAHGYLLAQFFSQITNQRTDKYGGSIENRSRLIVEIAQSIRNKVPASTGFTLGIKLNSVEFQEKGITADECRQLCVALEEAGFDFVELSGGNYEEIAFLHKKESTKVRESYFLEFADLIVPALSKTKVYVTGGLRTASAMVNAIKTVDGVGIGRPAAQEPFFARDILSGKITAASATAIDQGEFGLLLMLASGQMKEVAHDREPTDMSIPENVQGFMKDVGNHIAKVTADKEFKEYQPVDLSQLGVPYATANL